MNTANKLQPSTCAGDEPQADCWSRLSERSELTWGETCRECDRWGCVKWGNMRSEGRGGMVAQGTLGRRTGNSHQILPSQSSFTFKEIT